MKYQVWIRGRKEETLKEIEVPPYADGSAPTLLKVKGTACKSSFFAWEDYTNLRVKKL